MRQCIKKQISEKHDYARTVDLFFLIKKMFSAARVLPSLLNSVSFCSVTGPTLGAVDAFFVSQSNPISSTVQSGIDGNSVMLKTCESPLHH